MRRQDLEGLSREELIKRAEGVGVARPRALTIAELTDEILKRGVTNEAQRKTARGWLGRARDLLASVVERGLHLPDAARTASPARAGGRSWPPPPQPFATVTLAEIYAAQGHNERALGVVDEILARDPDNAEAKQLRAKLTAPKTMRPSIPPAPANDAAATADDTVTIEMAPPVPTFPEELTMSSEQEATLSEQTLITPEEVQTSSEQVQTSSEQVSTSSEQVATSSEQVETSSEQVETFSEQVQTSSEQVATSSEQVAAASEPDLVTSDVITVTLEVTPELAASATTDAVATTAAGSEASAAGVEVLDRYDVDEIVALAVNPETLYFYWEIRPISLARARSAKPHGAVVVRIATIIPSWEGPLTDTRDVAVDALVGDKFVGSMTPGAHVRVSVGWRSDDGAFEPLAVGVEVTVPRGTPAPEATVLAPDVSRWQPEGGLAPVVELRPTMLLAAAFDHARATQGRERGMTFAQANVTAGAPLFIERVTTIEPSEPQIELTIERRVIERVRAVGASELIRERFLEETTSRRAIPGQRLSLSEITRFGASELSRFGASELSR